MKEITILRVVKRGIRNHHAWRIIRCDSDKELEGTETVYDVPMYAKHFPEGTTYKKILHIPEPPKSNKGDSKNSAQQTKVLSEKLP